MRPALSRALALVLVCLPALARAQQTAPKLVAETEARSPAEERAGFHLPEGFVMELVASEPEINKPMNLAFDDRGRLWVTSTVEYPYPVQGGKAARDRVVILSDFADDGKARSSKTFAEGLNIPIGILPLGKGDSALVHDIPNIRRFIDTDGDGKADKTEIAYEKYGFRDTHGMTNAFSWGFDGWIYACHGFNNESKVEGSDKKPIVMQSGNVYRMKPDGSHAEYYSHGQVNPFGLAFDPMGNLYSCDCHSKPLYQLLRGAYYPSFGKPDDGLGFGPTMIDHDHGSTGIGGIAYYAADHFPEGYRNTTFIGNVVTSRINHDKFEWHGSSPKAVEQPDFVVSDDPWFRPVDIELGPDGALYVADFYNRIIGHYEVPLTHPGRDRERGRIWRIRYAGKDGKAPLPKTPRADESAATVAELVEDLGHPNLAVRTVATNQLVARGAEAIEPVKVVVRSGGQPASSFRTVHGLWVLHRLGALDDPLFAQVLISVDEPTRVHAMRILADRPTLEGWGRSTVLAGLASSSSATIRRAAAEALAQHPSADNLEPLLAIFDRIPPDDTHFKHVVRMALREQLRLTTAWDRVAASPTWSSNQYQRSLVEAALGVPSAESAKFLLGLMDRTIPLPAGLGSNGFISLGTKAREAHHVARYGGPESEATLVALTRRGGTSYEGQVEFFKAIQQGLQERGASPGADFRSLAVDMARNFLTSTKPEEVKAGIDLAGSMKLGETREILASYVDNRKLSWQMQRGPTLAALVRLDPSGSVPTLGRILRDSTEPVELREQASNLLSGLGKPEARSILVEALATAPSRLQTAIATGLAQNRDGAEALLGAVAAGKASARPLQERGVSVRLEASGVPDLKARLETLLKDLPAADRRIQDLIEKRKAGYLATSAGLDRSRGASVFEKNCANCHQIEGKGARVGPQLDGVGLRGLDRILEDVLDPNRNVDQAFRVITLALNDGRVASGLLLRQDGEVLVLADAQGKDVRVPASTVEDRKHSQLSPMPANMAEAIEEADFYQLLSYLLSQRPADVPASKP